MAPLMEWLIALTLTVLALAAPLFLPIWFIGLGIYTARRQDADRQD